MRLEVLDLFSAAAGGWSLGMHRAGFRTVAACESIEWRRALYHQNNPDVRLYDDVCTLTAEQLLRDVGRLPDVVVGSPPCQDISPANTKGQGVDGERSGLFFEAIRIIGEVRPRWIALENSHNLRTRGADRVLGALENIGYSCWPLVVRARNVGANHERPRCWIVGRAADATEVGHVGRWPWRHGTDGNGAAPVAPSARNAPDADQERQAHGRMVSGLRQAEVTDDGRGSRRGADGSCVREVGGCPGAGVSVAEPWADWNGGLADHLRVDDGLSAWVAQQRIAVGGPRGTSAASLIVEAFGDAVLPQIPEAIGRAILRTEAALAAVTYQPANDNAEALRDAA